LAACNQTGAGSVAAETAAALDPTGLAGVGVTLAQSAEAEANAGKIDFSAFGTRLSDVAAGNTAGPNYMAGFDRQAALVMARLLSMGR